MVISFPRTLIYCVYSRTQNDSTMGTGHHRLLSFAFSSRCLGFPQSGDRFLKSGPQSVFWGTWPPEQGPPYRWKNIVVKSHWNWYHWKEHEKLSIFHIRTLVWKWAVRKVCPREIWSRDPTLWKLPKVTEFCGILVHIEDQLTLRLMKYTME